MPTHPVAFGQFEGRAPQLVALESNVLPAQVTDYGGSLVSLEAPDYAGKLKHLAERH